jgi:hypothetical protein
VAIWIRVLAGVLGLWLQVLVLDAAIRTFLLPRVASVRLSRVVATSVGWIFGLLTGEKRSYAVRDRILSLYASILLLTYQALWLVLSLVAFACGFIALGTKNVPRALEVSGSSLLTLGTSSGTGAGQVALGFVEAAVGLTLLALLISFIPTLYTAFQDREVSVSRLAVRAGTPATPWGVLEIAQSVESYQLLDELWREWEQWFIEVGETHSTLTILNYYRSPNPDQTWIGSAATVLDAAALFNAAVDATPSPTAGICIRAGWLTLRRLADYFRIPYPAAVDRTIPISVTRDQFDLVLERLERTGVPIVADRDAAWWDFVGWRVNYDVIIEACHEMFVCPRTDWDLAALQPLFGRSNQRGSAAANVEAIDPDPDPDPA